ncbi:hypothetical protein [Pseudomonas sp. W2Jun17]|uniref:DUF883 family protein n=1 Tax=Pseudomonas sp. W2Jun17 TaxID=1553460 RepID=UPI0020030F50|nr:hypothetical protein [Pseudomonas sp. W2Jun17]MCK3852107.1 DUF883 domain-containing protein [Pseudomonas sp. W2Jun17]
MARKAEIEKVASKAKDIGDDELKKLINEASDLLADGESFVGDKAEAARKKLEAILKNANDFFPKDAEEAVDKGQEALNNAKKYAQEKPWHVAAIIGGVGLAAWLLSRRS